MFRKKFSVNSVYIMQYFLSIKISYEDTLIIWIYELILVDIGVGVRTPNTIYSPKKMNFQLQGYLKKEKKNYDQSHHIFFNLIKKCIEKHLR